MRATTTSSQRPRLAVPFVGRTGEIERYKELPAGRKHRVRETVPDAGWAGEKLVGQGGLLLSAAVAEEGQSKSEAPGRQRPQVASKR